MKFFDEPSSQKINISLATMVKFLGVLVVLLFLWFIRDVLGLLFVALVLSAALNPWVDQLQKYRIPRGMSIFTMYLILFAVVILLVFLVVPPLITQVSDISRFMLSYTSQLDSVYQFITQNPEATVVQEIQHNIANFQDYISSITSGVFETVTGFFSTLASILFVLVITFYLVIDEDGLKKFIRSIAPVQYQPYLVQKTNRIQERLGAWLSGQLLLMLIIGVVAFIGLFLLGVPYALVLALVAGFAEFIPFLGPILAAIPALFFAFVDEPWKAAAVLVFYTLMQQLENHIIVPMVMRRAVGLSPIVILAVMLIGAKVAGLAGILLAVPAAVIIWIFLEDVVNAKKQLDSTLE